jgi:hypothetical protein
MATPESPFKTSWSSSGSSSWIPPTLLLGAVPLFIWQFATRADSKWRGSLFPLLLATLSTFWLTLVSIMVPEPYLVSHSSRQIFAKLAKL